MPSLTSLLTLAIGASVIAAHGHGNQDHAQGLLARSNQQHHQRLRAKRAYQSNDRMIKSYKRGTHSKRGQTVYSTQAQYYAKTGGYSACHTYFDDNSMVFSLPTGLWPDVYSPSPLCGKKVVATNPATGQSLELTVQDASWFASSVQVPVGVFKQLGGSTETGVLPIEFHFVDGNLNLPESTSGATDIFGASKSEVRAAASSVASVKANVNAVVPTSAAATTTTQAAPTTTTIEAPKTTTTTAPTTTSQDVASIESVKLAAEQSSSSAAAAAASASAAAQAEADKKAEEEQKAAEEAERKKKEEEEAAAAAASSSAAAAAAASSSEAAAQATTTTEAAPEPTGTNNNNDGGNSGGDGPVQSGGYATYFLQNGNPGNCGNYNSDSTPLVALPTAVYDNGANCGRRLRITRVSDGRTVEAIVQDSCPTCVNNQSLDLSVGAFTALGSESEGMFPITWQYI